MNSYTSNPRVCRYCMSACLPSWQHACTSRQCSMVQGTHGSGVQVSNAASIPAFCELPQLSQEAIFSGVTHALYFQKGLSSSSRRRALQSGQLRSGKKSPIGTSAVNCCPRSFFSAAPRTVYCADAKRKGLCSREAERRRIGWSGC